MLADPDTCAGLSIPLFRRRNQNCRSRGRVFCLKSQLPRFGRGECRRDMALNLLRSICARHQSRGCTETVLKKRRIAHGRALCSASEFNYPPFMAKHRHELGPPMDLANMRRQVCSTVLFFQLSDHRSDEFVFAEIRTVPHKHARRWRHDANCLVRLLMA